MKATSFVKYVFLKRDLHKSLRRSANGFVGKGSDHLQLIKFWPSCVPGKGSVAGRNFWLRLTTTSAQCLRLSERFFIYTVSIIFFPYRVD